MLFNLSYTFAETSIASLRFGGNYLQILQVIQAVPATAAGIPTAKDIVKTLDLIRNFFE
jgi:hypothetical protein